MNHARTSLCIDADNLDNTSVRTQGTDHNPDGLLTAIDVGGITIQTYGITSERFANWLEDTARRVREVARADLAPVERQPREHAVVCTRCHISGVWNTSGLCDRCQATTQAVA